MMALNFASSLFTCFIYLALFGVNPLSNKSGILQIIDVLVVPLSLSYIAFLVVRMVALMEKIAYFPTYEEKISKQITELKETIKSMEQKGMGT